MLWRRSPRVHPGDTVVVDEGDLRDAYTRGRKDERADRRRHPILMTLVFLAAALGAVMLVVAVREGSFARGGVVVDRNLSAAADRAEPVVRDAGAEAGQALREAGDSAKSAADEVAR